MNTGETSSFSRGLVIVLSALFVITLGLMIAVPLQSGEGEIPIWTLLLNSLLLAIPIGLLYALLGVAIMAIRRQRRQEQISPRFARVVYWSPRIGGIVLVAFMSLFALDVFEEGLSLGEMLLGFFMHMLPMLALAAVLAIAWRWPWVGAAVFGLAALFFASRILFDGLMGLSTFLIFGGPLLVIALLFAANGRWQKEIDLTRHPRLPAA